MDTYVPSEGGRREKGEDHGMERRWTDGWFGRYWILCALMCCPTEESRKGRKKESGGVAWLAHGATAGHTE